MQRNAIQQKVETAIAIVCLFGDATAIMSMAIACAQVDICGCVAAFLSLSVSCVYARCGLAY